MEKKKKICSYPNAMIVVSLTAALFLIGFCGLLVVQSKKLVSNIRENIEVRVFLQKNITESGRDSLLTNIRLMPFIAPSAEGAPSINFISKEQAAQEFIEGTKEDFTKMLGENPLHDAFSIKISQNYFEEAKLKIVKTDLEKLSGIHEVVYQENLADDINRNIKKIYSIIAGFALVMLVIIVLLINNTIKLAIYSQRFLIRSMQLVGATDAFIQKPFISHGAWQGLTGGIVASVLLVILQQVAVRNMEGLSALQEYDKFVFLLAGLLVLGVLIGIVCTYQSLSRYLRIALDDLY